MNPNLYPYHGDDPAADWQPYAICPHCGGALELRRGDWLLCLPCQEIWRGYDELDAARAEVAAQNGE